MTEQGPNSASKIHSIILLVIVAVALLIGVYELHKYWTDKMPGDIESLATLALALLTIVLAYFNWKLSRDTSAALDLARKEFEVSQGQFTLSQKQFELTHEQSSIARKQYETEWRPDLRIATYKLGRDTTFTVANLGRSAALIKQIRVTTASDEEPHAITDFRLSRLVGAGAIDENIQVRYPIVQFAQEYGLCGGQPCTVERAMKFALVYDCAGNTNIESQWFHCKVELALIRDVAGSRIEIRNIRETP